MYMHVQIHTCTHTYTHRCLYCYVVPGIELHSIIITMHYLLERELCPSILMTVCVVVFILLLNEEAEPRMSSGTYLGPFCSGWSGAGRRACGCWLLKSELSVPTFSFKKKKGLGSNVTLGNDSQTLGYK